MDVNEEIIMVSKCGNRSKVYITVFCNVKIEDIILQYLNRDGMSVTDLRYKNNLIYR